MKDTNGFAMEKQDAQESSGRKLARREFLANLLFAGGLLSVTALQSEYDMLARRDPKDDGWELPKDDNNPTTTSDGWELPDDLLAPTNPPKPPRPPRPEPRPDGGMRPPQIRGRMKHPPPPPGSVRAPRTKKTP